MNYEQIKEEYLTDTSLTLKQLSAKYGVHTQTISKHLKKLGVEIRRGTPSAVTSSIEDIKQAYINNELITLQELATQYNTSAKRISQILQEEGIAIRSGTRKYTVNHHFFDVIDTIDKAYFLGLLAADGQVQAPSLIRLDLMEEDIHIIESFKNALNTSYPIALYPANDKQVARLAMHSLPMFTALNNLNIVQNKTLIFRPPILPEHLRSHFLRGYFDGDGCLTKNKHTNKYSFSILGTKEMIEFAQVELGLEHLSISQRFPEREKNNYTFAVSGNKQILRIMEYLYQDSSVSNRLERKYNKFLELKENPRSHQYS